MLLITMLPKQSAPVFCVECAWPLVDYIYTVVSYSANSHQPIWGEWPVNLFLTEILNNLPFSVVEHIVFIAGKM